MVNVDLDLILCFFALGPTEVNVKLEIDTLPWEIRSNWLNCYGETPFPERTTGALPNETHFSSVERTDFDYFY